MDPQAQHARQVHQGVHGGVVLGGLQPRHHRLAPAQQPGQRGLAQPPLCPVADRRIGHCAGQRGALPLQPELRVLKQIIQNLGTGGSADLKEIRVGPPGQAREEMRAWADEDYDPERFDLAAADAPVAAI
jgi:hypothetical protein